MTSLTVLLVDDNPDDRALVERELKHHIDGVQVQHAGDAQSLRAAIDRASFDLVITDYRLRWTTGTHVLREMKQLFPHKPVIMFTGSGSEEVAVNAMKEGLDDYITKTAKHYPKIPYAVKACFDRADQRDQLAKALERETLAKVRLEIALQSARMGTWQLDLHGNSVLYSPEIGPMFGREMGFAHGDFSEWLNDVHVDDRPSVIAAWEEAISGVKDYVAQFRALGADGQLRWIASSGKVIRDNSGLPKMVIGTARDITDEVRVKDKLLRQQEELQTILNVLPVGVVISHDPQADRLTFTPYLADLLGIEPGLHDSNADSSMPGSSSARPFKVYRNGQEVPMTELPMQRAARTGADVRAEELEVRLANGHSVDFLINTSPLKDEAGKVRGAVGALMDITGLKRTQQELEAANRQKTEFLSMLSHELRNPMAAIAYSTEMLRNVGSPEVINRTRAVIERQTAHMGRLLDDLLNLSRIIHNRIELDLKPLDVRYVIELGFEGAKSIIESSGHQISMTLPAEPLYVCGDEVRLTQVVTNILTNAAKFTPNGGCIEIAAFQDESNVIVEIRDSGVGIQSDKLDKIFEMFFQEKPKDAGGASGLGIGLAVVRKLVALHGGTVKAYSDGNGEGARFRVSLPVKHVAALEASSKEPLPSTPHHGVILVADDNVDAADLLGDFLRLVGYEVLIAYDGRSAMEQAKQFLPDLAILDIGMPHATGNEVAQWIREQPWGKRIVLIAVTGWGQVEDRQATLEAGFNFHLTKPVNAAEIAGLVSEQLSKEQSNPDLNRQVL